MQTHAGVRMVIYLDDMLFLHQKTEELVKIRLTVLDLLENLGFLINYEKSDLHPTRRITFLGVVIDSKTMEIRIPSEKVHQTIPLRGPGDTPTGPGLSPNPRSPDKAVLFDDPSSSPSPSALQGTAEPEAHQALRQGDYNTVIPLLEDAQDDLHWWIHHIQEMNGQPILRGQPSLEIGTDASLEGWGAHLSGDEYWRPLDSGGEVSAHKLPRASGCLLCCTGFAKERRNITIHLKMDSSTAIAYINHL